MHPAVFTSNVQCVRLAAGRRPLKMCCYRNKVRNRSIFDEVKAYKTKCASVLGPPCMYCALWLTGVVWSLKRWLWRQDMASTRCTVVRFYWRGLFVGVFSSLWNFIGFIFLVSFMCMCFYVMFFFLCRCCFRCTVNADDNFVPTTWPTWFYHGHLNDVTSLPWSWTASGPILRPWYLNLAVPCVWYRVAFTSTGSTSLTEQCSLSVHQRTWPPKSHSPVSGLVMHY